MRFYVPFLATLALASAVAMPAQAATIKHHYRHIARTTGAGFQYAAPRGPLYNGQDYLGNDPDPNIRSYILRDLDSRYGGR